MATTAICTGTTTMTSSIRGWHSETACTRLAVKDGFCGSCCKDRGIALPERKTAKKSTFVVTATDSKNYYITSTSDANARRAVKRDFGLDAVSVREV